MKKLILLLSIFVLSVAPSFDASARYRGDLNGDDRVDLADMVYLAKAIKAGTTDKSLDVNASGKVDDYDLQRLADIIISGRLTEDTGMNVGIGGWDDDGEDYGGAVKAPAFTTRSADETRFYMRDPKSEGNGLYSMEFGISEGNEAPAAILFSIRLPREMRFAASKIVELDPALSATHRLYGTPKFVKENENDEWSEYVLRFIVFSPDMDALPSANLRLGQINYELGDYWGQPLFSNCQVASTAGECFVIPEHWSEYYGNFIPVEVSSVWFDQSEMFLTEGDEQWLFANVEPWNATDQTLVWSCSDESVASMYTEDGRNVLIKALKSGEAVITATASNGISASCTVRVEKREIMMESILLDVENLELEVGDTHQFVATVLPAETTDPDLEWWVDDETVANIDQNGFVTMVGEGSTTVHVRSVRWNHVEASCRLDVRSAVDGLIADDAPIDIFTTNGQLLRKAMPPAEIQHLDRGVYFIRQHGKITKLLK